MRSMKKTGLFLTKRVHYFKIIRKITNLSALYEIENGTPKRLCEPGFLPKQTVNTAVTAFYKKGWIRMQRLPENRWTKAIHFTDEGRREAEGILQKVRDSEHQEMKDLSKAEREQLLSLTERYVTACTTAMKDL